MEEEEEEEEVVMVVAGLRLPRMERDSQVGWTLRILKDPHWSKRGERVLSRDGAGN